MKKRKLGNSDLYVSELTLGCMSLGTDFKTASEMIDIALEHGINHLDTADLYDFGLNEEIIGEVIKSKRQDIILTTKAGNHFSKESKDWSWDPSKKYITEALKNSLKRLQTDYVDFFMLHGGTMEDPIDETIEAMEELKKSGYIRAYGISSIRPNVIKTYIEKSSIDGVMLQYSMLDRRPEEEVLTLLKENNIGAISRGPLAKGLLTPHYKKVMDQKANKGLLDYSGEQLLEVLAKLESLSDTHTLNELAFQYILQSPTLSTITFGASSKVQLLENLNAYQVTPLSKDMYNQIKKITIENKYTEHRN